MANIYDKSSLVLIPSGTKTSKIFSQKPTNGDGDFTFTRASAATRVNADGNIEKETENVLDASQTFDLWAVNGGASVNANVTTAPDGTTSADRINMPNSGNGVYRVPASINGNVYTQSIYIKNDSNASAVRIGSDAFPSTAFVDFNVVTGTIITNGGAVITSNVEDAGSGWYRVSWNYVSAGSVNSFIIYSVNSSSSSCFVWGAQMERGLVARDYIETTTSAVYGGITDNVPRLDYTDSSCPALLLEPQRTNINNYSELLTSATGWTTSGTVTATSNYGISPEGVQNSTRIVFAGSNMIYRKTISGLTGVEGTFSLYIKGTEGETLNITYGGVDINITLLNGWNRYSVTQTGLINEIFLNTYSGSTARDIEVYGLQVELASYATSYIPTYGSSVSRVADACIKTGISSLIGQSEGTLFAEFEIDADNTNGFNRVLAVGDGTSNNRIFIFAQDTEVFRFYVANGGAAQVDIVSTTSILGGRHKVAFAYKANDFIAYVDGVQVGTDTSGTIPSCSNVYIGTHEAGSTQPLQGGVKQALVFKTRLSNEELAALTTI